MRIPICALSGAMLLGFASATSAVDIDWVYIGNPGNPADPRVMNDGTSGYGSVAYGYSVSKYEVTTAQYTEFLNAVAAADPNRLYDIQMNRFFEGIRRDGTSGSYRYTAVSGNQPVDSVNAWDAMRFANWLHNGKPVGPQGASTTEDGAYTITPLGLFANTITRNVDARIALTNENEWYKAAYYDSASASYFGFPTGSNTPVICSAPTGAPNHANCNSAVEALTPVGSYTGSASPYGTFDQAGNLHEWTETIHTPTGRVQRGGFLRWVNTDTAASVRGFVAPTLSSSAYGIRLVMVPEPGSGVLFALGVAGIAVRRRALRRAIH